MMMETADATNRTDSQTSLVVPFVLVLVNSNFTTSHKSKQHFPCASCIMIMNKAELKQKAKVKHLHFPTCAHVEK